MHWSLYVLMGAVLNVLVNLGYKIQAGKTSLFFVMASVMAIASLTLFSFGFFKANRLSDLAINWTPTIIIGMGIGSACIAFLLVSAFSKGPLSVVDPLWACLYAGISVVIGMFILREQPNMLTIAGITLYMIGAVLMAKGKA